MSFVAAMDDEERAELLALDFEHVARHAPRYRPGATTSRSPT